MVKQGLCADAPSYSAAVSAGDSKAGEEGHDQEEADLQKALKVHRLKR